MKRVFAVAPLACSLALSWPASAEETFVRQEPGRKLTLTKDWYGDSLLALYGTAYGAASVGFVLRLQDNQFVQAVGVVLLSGGVVTALIGAPVVHWSNDEVGRGFISMGGQVGAALVGSAIGVGVRETGDSSFHDAAPLIGAVVGHAAFALVDSLVLARRERVIGWESTSSKRRPAPKLVGAFRPSLRASKDALTLTLSAPFL